jgi:carboxylesterase
VASAVTLEELKAYQGPEHQPFRMGQGPGGVLLIHGFPGTPAEVRGIGKALAKNGWHARAPLLPGFGPDIVNLAEKRREDWLESVGAEWSSLLVDYEPCVLIGFSMGGALALHLAQRYPPDRLVLVAPFWRLPGVLPRLVPLLKRVLPEMRPFKNADFDTPELQAGFRRLLPDVDLDDPEVREYLQEEVTLPLSLIDEVFRLGAEAHRLAKTISARSLVIQGLDDQMVRPELTRKLVERLRDGQLDGQVTYREIGGPHELIHEGSEQQAEVIELISDFLNRES